MCFFLLMCTTDIWLLTIHDAGASFVLEREFPVTGDEGCQAHNACHKQTADMQSRTRSV